MLLSMNKILSSSIRKQSIKFSESAKEKKTLLFLCPQNKNSLNFLDYKIINTISGESIIFSTILQLHTAIHKYSR